MKSKLRALRKEKITNACFPPRSGEWDPLTDPRYIGKMASNRTLCSCSLCGNRRKWSKGKNKDRLTRQERQANEAMRIDRQTGDS